MPPVVVSNALLVAISGTISGRKWTNVWGLQDGPNGAGGGLFMSQTLANAIAAAFRTFYQSQTNQTGTGFRAQTAVVYDLQSATAPAYDAVFTEVVGAAVGDMLPPNLSLCVSHKTGLRGKSYRGRTYLCGYTEAASSSSGFILSSVGDQVLTNLGTLRTNLANIADSDLRQAVVSRTLGIAHEVTQSTYDTLWDHQDRRKR